MSFGGGPGESNSARVSTRPLLKHGYLEMAAPSDYKNLLVIMNDPDTILYIRDIVIAMDDSGGLADPQPYVNILLNGKPYVKDANFNYYYAGFGFGGSLKMCDNHKPIVIQVKTIGTVGILYASAYVTGIEVSKTEK